LACEQDWRFKSPESGVKEAFSKKLSGALFCYKQPEYQASKNAFFISNITPF
jgi:hypothetical protein